MNIEQANNLLLESASRLNNDTLNFSLISSVPKISASEITDALNQARTILKSLPITINTNSEKSWKISKEEIVDWIKFEPKEMASGAILNLTIDENAVKEYLEQKSLLVNQQPLNASLKIIGGEIATSTPAQKGVALDVDSSVKIIARDLLEGRNQLSLIINKTAPIINDENFISLGLTSLLGQGETTFDGSTAPRNENIKLAAAKFNGVLLAPGEEFIFGDLLGDVGPEQGYRSATVIKDGKKVQEYGGGICQVSTTAFRGAVKAGLKITERRNHSIAIPVYAPQGFDATVYPPNPDFRFINDTSNNVLIQTKIKGYKLIFEFYGTKEWDEVKLIGPTEYDKKEDGSMKAILSREIIKDGAVVKKDTWRSTYKPTKEAPVNPLQ
ncbi:MAG: hypothetical protein COU81_03115 [Candidatus Portnoybacteria bacterium CG10_big_fil_rev_8_21_14_0_10_36_7]|uniref:YoaR-like putative peptidoglycan binding domain-containing protein n=1 Tax=Candidatus Portnoybacteria bacterium CG10_big_fil_rev_8_21_14_0_10_36_7 TaxID=1974812 RepID=A0A2M8KDJ2_9BACT|nr:MAG: hypothetical protein COU81_03115 [Candidatus Portnoybacteria bacterium CG10_big_fil_rev_8_21_14_0_10_36_7]